jgi:hypothetical protein
MALRQEERISDTN